MWHIDLLLTVVPTSSYSYSYPLPLLAVLRINNVYCFYSFRYTYRESLLQQGAVMSETILDDDYEDYEYEPGKSYYDVII